MWKRIRAWFDTPSQEHVVDRAHERYLDEIAVRNQRIVEQQTQLAFLRAQQQIAEAQTRELQLDPIRELIEARQMAGRGPWIVGPETARQTDSMIAEATARMSGKETALRESTPVSSQGAWQDVELALANVEWRREVNWSWLEFSRWGIQQIILISRLHYIKNPIIRRLVDVTAAYVFGRGVSISSPDEAANDVLKSFIQRNKKTLGQVGLTGLERAKAHDGNLFFVFIPDQNLGELDLRTIDATEIMDIVTDPDDADSPWYYKRVWVQRPIDFSNPQAPTSVDNKTAWYPSLEYLLKLEESGEKPLAKIGGDDVMVDQPVHHRKCGAINKWHFGCPWVFPALDWAKAARRYLEASLTTALSLAQFALTLTTKGGMQALAGYKQQMQTTVAAGALPILDQNPPAGLGSTFAAGPGTELKAFSTSGAGSDPEKVRQYKLMCCMVAGVPETFLADVSTGNLATAASLDRPTELNFIEKQEAWREDLEIIAQYALRVSLRAPNGKLREAIATRKVDHGKVVIREVARVLRPNGRFKETPAPKSDSVIEVSVTFPAIREGDLPQLIAAWSQAGYPAGASSEGIDPRSMVEGMFEVLDVEDRAEILEQMFPEDSYADTIDRTVDPEPAPGFGPDGKPLDPMKAVKALTKAAEALRG